MRAENFWAALEVTSYRARRDSPTTAQREASACARRRPSPTSASRLFLVPGSQGQCVPGETRRRSPTPAGGWLPRPRRCLAGADRLSQPGRRRGR